MGEIDTVEQQTVEQIRASIRRMISDGGEPTLMSQRFEARVVEPLVQKSFARAIEEVETGVGTVAPTARNLREPKVMTGASATTAKNRLMGLAEGFSSLSDAPADTKARGDMVERATTREIGDVEAEVRSEETARAIAPTMHESGPPLDGATTEEPRVADAGSIMATGSRSFSGPVARSENAGDRHSSPASLMSPDTEAAMNGVFAQPAATKPPMGCARTVDMLVEDMLRPMLRAWLDINLPPLVERLVDDKIQRIARGQP
jgi:cell pole-organizing protein PopZ